MRMKKAALSICSALIDAGYETLFSGGCVRDFLLGKEPHDYDIATSATPEEICQLFPKVKKVGEHFGVILVFIEEYTFEVATFRKDGIYKDYRHPSEIKFANSKEDALRRDFTINGLFLHPFTNEVLDFVQGQKDLKKGILRSIGEPQSRFKEDPLRLLRAIRFLLKTQFQLETQTKIAIQENASLLKHISTERIRDELVSILLLPNRSKGIKQLTELGLMQYIIPEFLKLKGCEQPPQWHPEGDVYIHTLLVLDSLPEQSDITLALSALLHDIGKPPSYTYDKENERIRFNNHDVIGAGMTKKILNRLKFSNQIINDVSEMVANHMRFSHVQKMRISKLKRFMSRPTFPNELYLHKADCLSSHRKLDNYNFLQQETLQTLEKKENLSLPQALITGNDLIKLGFIPSPLFKKILNEVETKQLEGELKNKEEALNFAQNFSQK